MQQQAPFHHQTVVCTDALLVTTPLKQSKLRVKGHLESTVIYHNMLIYAMSDNLHLSISGARCTTTYTLISINVMFLSAEH